METRKRPHADDSDTARPKKRAVSGDRASPSHLNGTTTHSDEPKDGDDVELFRKEAIYRRMKHYSRVAERSEARVAELERRRSQCEAGLAALEACWTQLLGTIRSLVKPDDIPTLQEQSDGVRDLTLHVSSEVEPEFVGALRDKMQSTSDAVRALVILRGQDQGGPSEAALLERVQASDAENSVLRSELSLVRTKLRDAESEKEKFREELVAAEKHADRLQSRSLNLTLPPKVEDEPGTPVVKTSSSPQPPLMNGTHATDSEWQALAEHRAKTIEDRSKEISVLQAALQKAEIDAKAIPEEKARQTAPYLALRDRVSLIEQDALAAKAELAKLAGQLEGMLTTRQEFEESVKASSEATLQEMKNMLSKRDSELARIREQRDQHHAELHERRAKDSVKTSSLAEFMSLAETRAARIAVLESENQRLKTRLAANVGDEDLVAFLWSSQPDGPSFVDDLKRKLSDAEARVTTLEKSLAALEDDKADVVKSAQREAELQHQVERLQKQLDRYQAVYGNGSSLPEEAAQLSEQLQRKQDEIEKMLVQEKQREQAESALYSELDKLSAAWEALDRQVKSKVYDLSALEERVTKAGIERAKAENKFYATVRGREAAELERKNTARSLEKANKALEKATQSEKALSNRMANLEREIAQWMRIAEHQKELENNASKDCHEWRFRHSVEAKNTEEIRALWTQQSVAIQKKQEELRQLEESLIKSKKELEKQAVKLKSSSSSSSANSREAELQSEINKCMSLLKCSTCHMNMRNTVITKCMHSFCKSCVEARIATRQRKCPACNVPFSQGEVQHLFLQ
ncbi:BRE1-domain-containing protein [Lenzites betulinus]|nr:BRE1-domain-containing protein [Lenzites betulinus]